MPPTPDVACGIHRMYGFPFLLARGRFRRGRSLGLYVPPVGCSRSGCSALCVAPLLHRLHRLAGGGGKCLDLHWVREPNNDKGLEQ